MYGCLEQLSTVNDRSTRSSQPVTPAKRKVVRCQRGQGSCEKRLLPTPSPNAHVQYPKITPK